MPSAGLMSMRIFENSKAPFGKNSILHSNVSCISNSSHSQLLQFLNTVCSISLAVQHHYLFMQIAINFFDRLFGFFGNLKLDGWVKVYEPIPIGTCREGAYLFDGMRNGVLSVYRRRMGKTRCRWIKPMNNVNPSMCSLI